MNILQSGILMIGRKLKMIKNLFDSGICVDCGKPCHLGSGRGFNRYAVYTDEYEGWRCGECAEEVDALLEELKND